MKFPFSQGLDQRSLHITFSIPDTPDSQIHGVLTEDGHFDGHISTPSEHYYIEPAHR